MYILKDATWRMTEGEGPMQQVDNILSCVDPSLIYMAVYERTLSTSYDVKAGIIGKVATECDDNTSTDGEDEAGIIGKDDSETKVTNECDVGSRGDAAKDGVEDFVWNKDVTAFVLGVPAGTGKVAKKGSNSKKVFRRQAGKLSTRVWELFGRYQNESEGKFAAKELCGDCGFHWLQKHNGFDFFVCGWEECPFVMRLGFVGTSVEWVLHVEKGRQHEHNTVIGDKGFPYAIRSYVVGKWPEYRFLRPLELRKLLTITPVNSDLSIKERDDFKLAFQKDEVWNSFKRWFFNEKKRQDSMENQKKSDELRGFNVNRNEWNYMYNTAWEPTQGTLGEIHTWAAFLKYDLVKKRENFGPNSVYCLAYKLKEVCAYSYSSYEAQYEGTDMTLN